MLLLYILSGLALIQGIVSLRDGCRNMRYAIGYRRGPGPDGPVVVFCPVKGVEGDLETNARSLLAQNHPDYRVVFIVESAEDPAFGMLSKMHRAEVLVAGQASESGQKAHNLREGVARYGESGEIFVFSDADARFEPDWLVELVAPLSDREVGAASGYRWYVPGPGSLPALVRSAWNATVAGFLGPHSNNFVWGGSTAIRRETFQRIGGLDYWKGALSDDYALTSALREAGFQIVFVPTCLVASYGACTWRELLEFTTRQIRITRIYAPRIWALGLTTYTLFNITFLWLTLAMFTEISFFLLWLAVYALAGVRADARLRAVAHVIDHSSLAGYRWFYRLSPPLVGILYQVNFVASFLSRRVVWKGIRYTLISPNQTRVERLQ